MRAASLALILLFGLPSMAAPDPPPAASPDFLGRGYTPHLNQLKNSPVSKPAPSVPTGASSTIAFGLLATNSDFERVLNADMTVSTGGSSWGAKVKASLSKEYRESQRSITFAATRQVVIGTVELPSSSVFTKEAAKHLRNSPVEYIKDYGTSVVTSVDVGGATVLLFTFQFASEEEAMRFSLNAEGRYGATSGELNLSVRELLKKASNNVTVSGFVTGTTKLPTFFGETSKTTGPAIEFYSAKYSEAMLQRILDYVDSFDETIKNGAPTDWSQVGFTANHLGTRTDVTLSKKAEAAFKAAEAAGDLLNNRLAAIDERKRDITLMTSVYKPFNTEANLTAAAVLRRTLDNSDRRLTELRKELSDYGKIDLDDAKGVVIPSFPATFCTSEPTDISPRPVGRFDTGNPQNRTSSPPRKWMEFVVTPKAENVTYTLQANATLGHSRTDPGCNNAEMKLVTRPRAVLSAATAPEFGSWSARPSHEIRPPEIAVDVLPNFQVCRRQADRTFSTKRFAFVAADTADARVLYSNWDDTRYTTMHVRVFRCGQLPEEGPGPRSDLAL